MSHPRPRPDLDDSDLDSSPDLDAPPDNPPPVHRVELNPVQVVASTGAAVCAAVLTSFFGVTGTVVGTAASSVLATVGTAVYVSWLRRGRSVITTTAVRLPLARRGDPPPPEPLPDRPSWRSRLAARRPQRPAVVALSCVLVFGLAIGIVSLVEVSTGRTLNAVVTGKQATGVSILGDTSAGTASTPASTPATESPTSAPGSSATPSDTGGTPTPTPSGSAGTPSPEPTGSAGSGSTPVPSPSAGAGTPTPAGTGTAAG